ncbi:DUF2157 domain-containing protein [Bryobacter aggregatus]|uniref:DUF2157 domain-containing protein n=1 Tax=Bryobacter aggregatus TaxID=360054 RepID=UPI0004E1BA83|nr:DUF2157 domain-containing protein [Bryobacter aggregatus]
MTKEAEQYLSRWLAAGFVNPLAAEKIREWETQQSPVGRFRWGAAISWGLGALLIGTGVISFVAANWDQMSSFVKMLLIVALTMGFHFAAGLAEKTPALRMALHGVGTACLGAGIALAGQVFQLDGKWNGWMLLWAAGAAVGYWLIRDGFQLTIVALLVPLWITSEWYVRRPPGNHYLPELCFWLGLSVLYLLSRYRPLIWLGSFGLMAATIIVMACSEPSVGLLQQTPLPAYWADLGAIGLLALLGWKIFDGFNIKGFTAIAAVALVSFGAAEVGGWMMYLTLAIAFGALISWGVAEHRVELVNNGMIGFAMTVFGFYTAHALSLLGGAAGLILLGILLTGGGFLLEKVRRRLVVEAIRGQQ